MIGNAKPCPFCGCTVLHFVRGSVACDNCQAEGPFVGHFDEKTNREGKYGSKAEAVRLWNKANG